MYQVKYLQHGLPLCVDFVNIIDASNRLRALFACQTEATIHKKNWQIGRSYQDDDGVWHWNI